MARATYETDRAEQQIDEIGRLACPLADPGDLDPVLARIGDARIVQIGEASHGTSEYYRWRAELTKRLITEHGFSFVAVEGDWPDTASVTDWLFDDRRDGDARSVLAGFERWPTWMWANEEVAEFLDWLKAVDSARPPEERVGFFGLDVYSLWDSLRAVLEWLREHEPDAVEEALRAFRCFEPYAEDPQEYARAVRLVPESCEHDVVELLSAVRREVPASAPDRLGALHVRQNAEVVAGAERYYRTMVRGGGSSWNVRDVHMADTLDRLLDHHGPGARGVVWAHNTHVGDARATDMATAGMVNLGQLARERHGDDEVVLVGFGSHRGSVVAGAHWGADAEVMAVPDAQPGTHEDLLDSAVDGPALVVWPSDASGLAWARSWRGHRAIGVVYQPDRDRSGNWVPSLLGARYDAFLYLPETTGLRPLAATEDPGRELETAPWGT